MRIAIIAIALLAAACGSETTVSGPIATTQGEDAHAGAASVSASAGESFTVDARALVGTWDPERTCASDGGIMLSRDGRAGTADGNGTWAIANNNRVVLTLEGYEMGVGPTGETVIYNIDVAAPVTDDLIGTFSNADGSYSSALNALRCPVTP